MHKYIKEAWDSEKQQHTKQIETVCEVFMSMKNGYNVPIIHFMNETLFEEFVSWVHKSLAFANIAKRSE